MKLKAIILSTLISVSLSALTVGEIPKEIIINDENGGLVKDNGAKWNSNTIRDKVHVMFYVDPDEKDTNNHFSDTLKAKKYDRSKYASLAIINLAATWKPNFVIESILKDKQIEFPDTIYVKDKNSVLVNGWDVADNASNIILFSKTGEVLFYKSGAMTKEDTDRAITIIEENL